MNPNWKINEDFDRDDPEVVKARFLQGYSGETRRAVYGMFDCYIDLGHAPMDAVMMTLNCVLEKYEAEE